MRKFFLFLISLLIGLLLFSWIIKAVGWPEIKRAFLVFTGWQGMAILGLTILMILIGTWRWKEILRGIGIRLSFEELWKVYLASFSIRYLFPIIVVGAEIFQGHILKERNSVAWSKGMASVVLDRILEWTVNLVVIFFGLLFFLLAISLPPIKLGLMLGGVFLFFFALIVFFYFKSFKRESIIGFFFKNNQNQPLETEKEIFDFFKQKKLWLWKGFGLSFLRAGIMLLRTWLLIIFLGKNIGGLSALSILGFSSIAVMIPFPAALGSHEAIQVFAFSSLGLGASIGTAFTMIIRGAEIILAFCGIIILFPLEMKLLKKYLISKNNTL